MTTPQSRGRCAIYTRKSSEEGLEQSFNSLHAQGEACEAYIQSQKHEGWQVLPSTYDDGGFSGGNMERPVSRSSSLTSLLARSTRWSSTKSTASRDLFQTSHASLNPSIVRVSPSSQRTRNSALKSRTMKPSDDGVGSP